MLAWRACSAMRLRSAAITMAAASSSRSFQLAVWSGERMITSWMPLASACTWTGTEVVDRHRVLALERGIAVRHHADLPRAVAPLRLERRRRGVLRAGAERAGPRRVGLHLLAAGGEVVRALGSLGDDGDPPPVQRVQSELAHCAPILGGAASRPGGTRDTWCALLGGEGRPVPRRPALRPARARPRPPWRRAPPAARSAATTVGGGRRPPRSARRTGPRPAARPAS